MQEFGYYIYSEQNTRIQSEYKKAVVCLFGACRNKGNHCETTKLQLNILSGTQLTVKQYDFSKMAEANKGPLILFHIFYDYWDEEYRSLYRHTKDFVIERFVKS